MSECIVRMEMPECCDECPMEYDGFMCSATITRFYPKKDGRYLKPLIDPYKERLPNCPIVCALPEKHGRLVDADVLKEKAVHYSETEYHFDHDAIEMDDIDDAPTIVPAKEEI